MIKSLTPTVMAACLAVIFAWAPSATAGTCAKPTKKSDCNFKCETSQEKSDCLAAYAASKASSGGSKASSGSSSSGGSSKASSGSSSSGGSSKASSGSSSGSRSSGPKVNRKWCPRDHDYHYSNQPDYARHGCLPGTVPGGNNNDECVCEEDTSIVVNPNDKTRTRSQVSTVDQCPRSTNWCASLQRELLAGSTCPDCPSGSTPGMLGDNEYCLCSDGTTPLKLGLNAADVCPVRNAWRQSWVPPKGAEASETCPGTSKDVNGQCVCDDGTVLKHPDSNCPAPNPYHGEILASGDPRYSDTCDKFGLATVKPDDGSAAYCSCDGDPTARVENPYDSRLCMSLSGSNRLLVYSGSIASILGILLGFVGFFFGRRRYKKTIKELEAKTQSKLDDEKVEGLLSLHEAEGGLALAKQRAAEYESELAQARSDLSHAETERTRLQDEGKQAEADAAGDDRALKRVRTKNKQALGKANEAIANAKGRIAKFEPLAANARREANDLQQRVNLHKADMTDD